ncbi:MAG: septal ring lytic transglycosylase RlpA family protein [Terriglobia bacterium]
MHRVEYGLASWYGQRFQDHLTASGVPFNKYELTAAHNTFPLGVRVKVTNLRNGRSVVVTINDRGPKVRGCIIDLSRAAARRIEFVHRGITPVKITVLKKKARRGEGLCRKAEERERLAGNRVYIQNGITSSPPGQSSPPDLIKDDDLSIEMQA